MTIPVIISVENAIRLLKNKVTRDVFFNVEIGLQEVNNKDYRFEVFQRYNGEDNFIVAKSVKFLPNGAVFSQSHEDPIISDGHYTYLSMAIERQQLKAGALLVRVYQGKEIFFEQLFDPIDYSCLYQDLYTQLVDTYTLKTHKNSSMTLHLNTVDNIYSEEYFKLLAGESFNFSSYIDKYSYIGIQFSFEDLKPEVEEKYIIKGQKGIYQSGVLHIKDQRIECNIDFRDEYLTHYHSGEFFTEVKTIDDIIEYHLHNPLCYFEIGADFLIESYQKKLTYSQSGLYSLSKLGKSHTEAVVCQGCRLQGICLQVVPSGLSYQLFKENIIFTENEQNKCRIFNLIASKTL